LGAMRNIRPAMRFCYVMEHQQQSGALAVAGARTRCGAAPSASPKPESSTSKTSSKNSATEPRLVSVFRSANPWVLIPIEGGSPSSATTPAPCCCECLPKPAHLPGERDGPWGMILLVGLLPQALRNATGMGFLWGGGAARGDAPFLGGGEMNPRLLPREQQLADLPQ